jgi:solute carrier family 40 (iron-regulated transporter), member 1
MASTTGVGDQETAPLLATSPTASTGVIHSQYQSLSQINSNNEGDSSDISSTDPEWTLGQSARRLYISHTLSTWNSRVFEFGSVLYLASIFPGTLMPLAIYSIVRGASAITLSSWVGSYIDRKDRLNTVRLSIGRSSEALMTDDPNLSSLTATCCCCFMRYIFYTQQRPKSFRSTAGRFACSINLHGLH